MKAAYIPPRTAAELVTPAAHGERHTQMQKIIPSLIGQGFAPEAVFAQLRAMYDQTVGDQEIVSMIRWASGKNFTPCGTCHPSRWTGARPPAATKPLDPVANIKRFLGDFRVDDADLWHVSLWRPLENWQVDSIMFVAGMFHGGELVNIVTDHTVDPKGKANPKGYGMTLERDAAMRYVRDKGTPQSEAGAWLRMNPIDGKGVADANVTAFRFALIEFDGVPLDLQLSLLARLPLPVNAILLSGGRSAHGLVRVNAPNADTYRYTVNEMLNRLARFGVDQANKNPSRLCRLPGAQRQIGAQGDGQQRLLYLAPDRTDSQPIFQG